MPDAQVKGTITRWQHIYNKQGFNALLVEASKPVPPRTSVEIVVREGFFSNQGRKKVFLVDTDDRGWFVGKSFVRINPDKTRKTEMLWDSKVRLVFGSDGQVTEAINL